MGIHDFKLIKFYGNVNYNGCLNKCFKNKKCNAFNSYSIHCYLVEYQPHKRNRGSLRKGRRGWVYGYVKHSLMKEKRE